MKYINADTYLRPPQNLRWSSLCHYLMAKSSYGPTYTSAMGKFIVNIGNFIEGKSLCKVSNKDFRVISFEVLVMFFTTDFERIFISPVLVTVI